MWLPAMPVYTSLIWQSAISSASSSTRWIDAIVASMFTTTPFLRPREGALPRPMTLSTPSGLTSATMATIFEVPMSRPTIRFLLSFMPSFCWSYRRPRVLFAERRHACGEAVAIPQVHHFHFGSRTRECAERLPVRGHEARETRIGFFAAKLQREVAIGAGRAKPPATARREAHFGQLQRQRAQHLGPRAEALGHLAGTRFGSLEL